MDAALGDALEAIGQPRDALDHGLIGEAAMGALRAEWRRRGGRVRTTPQGDIVFYPPRAVPA